MSAAEQYEIEARYSGAFHSPEPLMHSEIVLQRVLALDRDSEEETSSGAFGWQFLDTSQTAFHGLGA